MERRRSSVGRLVSEISALQVDTELRSILIDIALCLTQLTAEVRDARREGDAVTPNPYRERIRQAGLRHLERVDGRRAR